MIKILKHLKTKEWAMIFASLIFIVSAVWLDLKMPEYMKKITELVQAPGGTIAAIWKNGGYMLLCALGSLVCSVAVGFFAAKVGASFSMRVRGSLFSKVDSFSMGEINNFSTASLITRSTNDVTQVQMFVTMGLMMIVKAPILATWAIIKISGKGFEWTLATGIAVAILLLMFALLLIFVMPKFKKIQNLTDNTNKIVRENLTGLAVVKAYNAEQYQQQKFENVNGELTKTNLFVARAMSFMNPVMNTVMSGLSLAIYLIGAALISKAHMMQRLDLFSNMVVFMSYAMQVIMAFMMITMLFIFMPRASVSAKRINQVLDTKPQIKSGTKTKGEDEKIGQIEFENVCFKYPGAAQYVLKDINLSIQKGQTVAFIGSTGSGKSTLINLITRFYDASQGSVKVGGVDVRDYKLSSLYSKIGYIPQKAVMFSGTVWSNVAFGQDSKDVAMQDVQKAISIAQGTDFVENMPNTYYGEIARGGANISGGQKQRLSIARAVCKNPEIYIFDDSFSALDYKTDRSLRTELKKQTSGATTLIVAQRIGTIMDADQIVVLDQGTIVGIGTHKELLNNCTVYKEIAMSQLSEKELGNE